MEGLDRRAQFEFRREMPVIAAKVKVGSGDYQRYIENPLSIQLLSGELSQGHVLADVEDDAIVFRAAERASIEQVPADEVMSESSA